MLTGAARVLFTAGPVQVRVKCCDQGSEGGKAHSVWVRIGRIPPHKRDSLNGSGQHCVAHTTATNSCVVSTL